MKWRRNRRSTWILLAVLFVLAVAGWLGSSFAVTWGFTRRQRAPFPEPARVVEWATIEERRIDTRDGETLGAWIVAGRPEKPCVLLFHGHQDCRGSMLGTIELLVRAGHGVVAVSHRSHGDSTGERNDFGWSAREDVVAAVGFAEKAFPGRKIAVLGRSMGAAAAIFAAGELERRVSGYILESPYPDIKTAVKNRTENYLPPGLDWLAYTGLVLWSPFFLPVEADRISPREEAGGIPAEIPVLFLNGTADRHSRLEDVEAIRARVPRARLVRFEGAAHGGLLVKDRALYEREVLALLASL